MARYYLSTALRNLARDKLFATINLLGLVVGMSAAFLIGLYVNDELSYDRWLPGHESIYRATAGMAGQRSAPTGPSDLGQWLELDFPQLEVVTRLFSWPATLGRNNEHFNEQITWADANVFELLRFPAIAGNLVSALEDPHSLVLTRSTALKYFGRPDPIGESLLLDAEHEMVITAVIEDLPSNTHLNIDVLAPGHALFSPAALQDRNPLTHFGKKMWNSRTYFRLAPIASIDELRRAIPAMLDRHTPIADPRPASEIYEITILPIGDIHLSPLIPGEPIDLRRVYAVSAVGLLIILAAAINFVSLMTALGIRRAKEVGIRKTAGARRVDLIKQFMSESSLYVFLGCLGAAGLSAFLLDPFNAYLLRSISVTALISPASLAATLAVIVLLAFLAGVYPSVVLSAFPPAIVLGNRIYGGSTAFVRHCLVAVQFTILISLLIAATVIMRQIQFGRDEALRQNTDPILVIFSACSDSLKNELLALPEVESVACAAQIPQFGIGSSTGASYRDAEGQGVYYAAVDFGFFELYGLQSVAGRLFSEDLATDSSPAENVWTRPEAIVINEEAASRLGFPSPEDAVGEIITWDRYFELPTVFTGEHDAEIIGVVEDFQTGSVREEIKPAAFYVDHNHARSLSLKLSGRNVPEALDAIDRVWDRFGESRPIRRSFFDVGVENMYRDLTRQAQLLTVSASVAIFISVLGLMGLAAFIAERRTKEVGIRKVLGGSRWRITRLMLWQFLKPVLLANAIAWPVANYLMNIWLQGFARHIETEFWMFLIPAVIALFAAFLAVFPYTYSKAGTKPISALRHD